MGSRDHNDSGDTHWVRWMSSSRICSENYVSWLVGLHSASILGTIVFLKEVSMMNELNVFETQMVSGGLDLSWIAGTAKLGMQIGAPLGVVSGALVGFIYGASRNSLLEMCVAPISAGYIGYFAGAVSLGFSFGFFATAYNVTTDFTSFLYD